MISSSPQEHEFASGEETLLVLCPRGASTPFSKTKLLDTLAESGVACGFTMLFFTSGGEGAPVTRPPVILGVSSQVWDGLLSELPLLVLLVWGKMEAGGPGEVSGDGRNVEKGRTAAKATT